MGLEASDLPPQMDRESWPDVKDRFAAIFKTKTRAEWCAILEGSEACFAPVLSLSEAPDHPHLKARGTLLEAADIVQPRPAPRYSRTSPEAPLPPCLPGEHTDQVLAELGFAEEEIAELRAKNVVA